MSPPSCVRPSFSEAPLLYRQHQKQPPPPTMLERLPHYHQQQQPQPHFLEPRPPKPSLLYQHASRPTERHTAEGLTLDISQASFLTGRDDAVDLLLDAVARNSRHRLVSPLAQTLSHVGAALFDGAPAAEAPPLPSDSDNFSTGFSAVGLTQAEEALIADCSALLGPQQLRLALTNFSSNAIGSQMHGPVGANVFVFHIPNEWHEKDLALQFAQFGPLLSARIATDKATGRRLGFGFVSYTNIASACDAVEHLNGHSVAGKRLKVTIKRGEQQHAATFRCDSASPSPLLHASVVPPPPHRTRSPPSSLRWNGVNIERKLTDVSPSPVVELSAADELLDEYATNLRYYAENRSSQQSTVPTQSDREDSSMSETSLLKQSASPLSPSDQRLQQNRLEEIFTLLLQYGATAAATEQNNCKDDESWLENLALVMQSPSGARFMTLLLQAARVSLPDCPSMLINPSPPEVSAEGARTMLRHSLTRGWPGAGPQ